MNVTRTKKTIMNLIEAIDKVKAHCLANGCPNKISIYIAALKKLYAAKVMNNNPELAYLEGNDRNGYLHDMKIAQRYADLNRYTIAINILRKLGMIDCIKDRWTTVHNYLGDDNIIRKSAISAKKGEKVLIPLNMRDGSIIGIGKGNDDWNNSAPHGAGRLMSRSAARKSIDMDDYRKSMTGIFTTSVNADTIDEAPMAYKPSEKIVEQIAPTVDVIKVIKPIYNFKASE